MKDFLICVDSDGCVFDNMKLKHKECFCPATVNIWSLQNVSRYARETAEFVNLYSKARSLNRFPALVRTLELHSQRHEVQQRNHRWRVHGGAAGGIRRHTPGDAALERIKIGPPSGEGGPNSCRGNYSSS